ncbi:MAG: ABC transporter transmembrane domain-containing protein [Janibacter sp.]
MSRHRGRLALGVALLVVWQLCETFVPVMIGVVIDRAVATSEVTSLVVLLLAFAGLFAVLSFAYRFGARHIVAVVEQETHAIRVEIAAHALHPRGVRSTALPGQTLSLASADAELVGLFVRLVGFAVSAVLSIGVAAVVLFRIDTALGFVVVLGVPLVLGLAQLVTPVISRRTERQQEGIADASGSATDLVRGLRVLKGIGGEHVAGQRYRRLSRRAQLAGISSTSSVGMMTGLTGLLSGLFLAVVALIAGHKAVRGEITIGELVAVVGLTQFLAEPLQMLGEISAFTARSLAAARRISAYLHTPRLVAGGTEKAPGAATLGLTLPGGDRLTCEPGEILGLAVADPAEADAIMRMLAGEDSGEVILGGADAATLSTSERRAHLLVSPHHVDLFEGSLRSNLDPHDRLDDGEIAELLERSSAADVVELAADGLDEHLSPDGATWSGGQRQRIALARALAATAPVLVLHDPTTAVDAVTEHRIADGIRAARAGRTTWLLTSSPALLARADRVVLVREGRIVAEGSHHDLAHEAGYRELVLR